MNKLMAPILLSFVLSSGLAEASPCQVVMGLQEQVKRADAAFLGRVESLREEPVPEKRMCFTHVTFSILDLLFDRSGTIQGTSVTLVFAGGRVGEETVSVSGVPSFREGDTVVVLTTLDGKRYASPIVGLDQGLYRLAYDARDGSAYPTLPGGRGIEAVKKGAILSTDQIERIESAIPRYAEKRLASGPARAPAPTSSPGAPGGQSARESTLRRARPQRLLGLTDFLDAIRSLHAEQPEGRR